MSLVGAALGLSPSRADDVLLACACPIQQPGDLLEQEFGLGGGEEQFGVFLVDLVEGDQVLLERVGNLRRHRRHLGFSLGDTFGVLLVFGLRRLFDLVEALGLGSRSLISVFCSASVFTRG